MPTAKVTSKGQITIPQGVRNRLRLKAGDRVDFVFLADGELVMRPKRTSFEELRGTLSSGGRTPVSVEEMDEGISRAVRKRWVRAR